MGILFYLNNTTNLRHLAQRTIIIALYPQNGGRIVTIDSVTSPHPMYIGGFGFHCRYSAGPAAQTDAPGGRTGPGEGEICCLRCAGRRVRWSERDDDHAAERRPLRRRPAPGQVSPVLVCRRRHSDGTVRHVAGGGRRDGAARRHALRRPDPPAQRRPARLLSRGQTSASQAPLP